MPTARGILTSTFVASVLFVGLLIAPLMFANVVEQGELDDFFSVGGTSGIAVAGIESTADLGFASSVEANPVNLATGDIEVNCFDSALAGGVIEISDGAVTNTTTNLTHFGESYASTLLDYRGKVADTNIFTTPPAAGEPVLAGTDVCSMEVSINVTAEDLMNTQRIKFVLHEAVNNTWEDITTLVLHKDASGVVLDSVLVDHTGEDYLTGSLFELPLTTIDRLLIDQTFPDTLGAGESLSLVFFMYDDAATFPQEGDLMIYDLELEADREGVLSETNKLTVFNIGYALVGGLLVVVATPWVRWDDIFGGLKRDRRGQMNIGGIGALAVIGVLVIGGFMLFGGGSFTGFFTASLLPLSLAIVGIALVSMTTRGKTSPGLTFGLAAAAGIIGWLVGRSVQNNWLPYDMLYVAPFLDVVTGQALGSAFAISAFFVVVVQIAGTLVALFNATQTITTDDTASLVQ